MNPIWWENERDFHSWSINQMGQQGWDAQILNDQFKVGLPDLNAAHRRLGSEVWAECKVAQKVRTVHQQLVLDHPVTAQQRRWLVNRDKHSTARCGLLIAWRTEDGAGGFIPYVTWMPIREWHAWEVEKLMSWGLRNTTSTPAHLTEAGEWLRLFQGRTRH